MARGRSFFQSGYHLEHILSGRKILEEILRGLKRRRKRRKRFEHECALRSVTVELKNRILREVSKGYPTYFKGASFI